MTSFLVLCPFVHRPSFDQMWATLAPGLQMGAAVIDNTQINRGAAASRNMGARQVVDRGLDWLVDISPVTRFGPEAGRDFVSQLADHPDAWIVQASTPVNWHCIAWHRRLFETVGYMDENMHPIYGEDADISYRVHQWARENEASGLWACVDVDAWVTMYGHSRKLAGIEPNMTLIWDYYKKKWGGLSGSETFTRPFGDDTLGLDFWPMPPDPRSIYDEVRR